MVRPLPCHHVTSHFSSIPLAIGLFASLFALVALCAKRPKSPRARYENDLYEPPKSPLATPKRILTSISSNIKPNNKRSNNNGSEEGGQRGDGFGEGGLWQKNILMGEKCQPLEFSGVIYYDNYGHRVSEIPRSPRASAANALQGSFSFPVSSHHSG
uniref:Transmembrane protein n=1 Tax=Opuntia streptacantha TaxID=393608 RepID=A0A7C9DF86_OPUST